MNFLNQSVQDDTRLDTVQSLGDRNEITIGIGLPTKDESDTFVSMIFVKLLEF